MEKHMRAKWIQVAVRVLFLAALLATGWFGIRSHGSFLLLRSAHELGMPEISSIRGWMTLGYVATTYRVPEKQLITGLGLPADTPPDSSLKSLAEQLGLPPFSYIQQVQRTIADAASRIAPPEARAPSGWFERLRDDMLSALLVYGYPILGLTFLLGAMGLPLPTGLSATVAGSLSALDRMDWWVAAIVIIAASIIGDVAAYMLGRTASQRFLTRWGRWIGYGSKGGGRAQVLFEQWGGLTVLLTRTLISHLSSVVSLLAGLHRYRLSAFLAYDMLGRAIWTFAYMGLGYTLAGSIEAATDFLGNLTGLLLSFSVLVGSAMAMGRTQRTSKIVSQGSNHRWEVDR
jgi:membrane protein DedA with SNARE-associated domain